MKTKITAKLLLPVVLAIWGLIGWKLYAVMNGSDDPVALHTEPSGFSPKEELLPDSIFLIASYRDPFLGKMTEVRKPVSSSAVRNTPAPAKTEVPKTVTVFPKINYYGLVRRNGNSKTVGFLNIDGRSHFVQSGETIGELRVQKIWNDSVELIWGKEKRVVRK